MTHKLGAKNTNSVGAKTMIALAVFLGLLGCGKEGPCPDGAKLTGKSPPDGHQQWCVKEDKDGNIVKHGKWRSWHENGQKSIEGGYRNNAMHGQVTRWASNGTKTAEGQYSNGKEQGLWRTWSPDSGSKDGEVNYVDGLKSGVALGWYSNGTKKVESSFENDTLHGRVTNWHSNGQKASEGEYRTGEKTGTWTEWNETGRKIEEQIHHGDRQSTLTTFSESGVISMIAEMNGRRIVKGTVLDENGKPKRVTEFLFGQPAKITKYVNGKETDVEVVRAGRWSILASTSDLDDSPRVVINASAIAEVQNWVDKTVRPRLILRCVESETNVIIETGGPSEMELHNFSSHLRTVFLRFDKNPAKRYLASQSTSRESLFLKKPVAMIKQMLAADTLVFRHTVSQGGDQIITFDLRELDQVLPKLQTACRW